MCVVIGDEDTVLHMNALFQDEQHVPPTAAFGIEDTGLMTPLSCKDIKTSAKRILEAHKMLLHCHLYDRQRCSVIRYILCISS